jgi:hypothetical protein
MAGAALVDDDVGIRVRPREVTDAAGVIQVDVRDGDRRKIAGPDAERFERLPHRRR